MLEMPIPADDIPSGSPANINGSLQELPPALQADWPAVVNWPPNDRFDNAYSIHGDAHSTGLYQMFVPAGTPLAGTVILMYRHEGWIMDWRPEFGDLQRDPGGYVSLPLLNSAPWEQPPLP